MAQIYLCDGGSVPAPPCITSLGDSETLQLQYSISAHSKHWYLLMAPGSEQVSHGTDKLQSIREELKIPFNPSRKSKSLMKAGARITCSEAAAALGRAEGIPVMLSTGTPAQECFAGDV